MAERGVIAPEVEPEVAGVAIALGAAQAVSALTGGLLGWLLVMKKNVL
jgi:hypothetical protein